MAMDRNECFSRHGQVWLGWDKWCLGNYLKNERVKTDPEPQKHTTLKILKFVKYLGAESPILWSRSRQSPSISPLSGVAAPLLRLTYNFFIKGGFSGGEDYRWAVIRRWYPGWRWEIFNLVFICCSDVERWRFVCCDGVWNCCGDMRSLNDAPCYRERCLYSYWAQCVNGHANLEGTRELNSTEVPLPK